MPKQKRAGSSGRRPVASRPSGDEPAGDVLIPGEFVSEAASHALRTGVPLLRYAHVDYARELVAWPTGEGYDLALGNWIPPRWREYAAATDADLTWLAESKGLDADELDLPMPEEAAWQLLDESETELGEAYKLLAPFRGARFVRESSGAVIGELEFVDAWYLSNHVVTVTAPSALLLSCLQHELDRRAAGIRIILAEA